MYQRIYGPYLKRGRFHVHVYKLDGTRKYETFPTEEEALDFIQVVTPRVASTSLTVGQAISEYIQGRTDLRESSRKTLRFRLDSLVRDHAGTHLQAFPAKRAWSRLAEECAVDTLHGVRSAANGFFRWCIKLGHLKKNLLDGIEIVGQKKRGKEQLRIDEARSFLERSLAIAEGAALPGRTESQQTIAVLGAATALLLGLRRGEVVGRVVRDLDDGGKVLWIPESKTEAGVRRVEVPEVLAPHLLRVVAGKAPMAPLFEGLTPDGLRYWTARLCKELGVPCITVHGLRGTHATASMQPHANPHAVAAALGHTSFKVTQRHYARPEAIASARQRAAVDTLVVSKSVSKNLSKTFGQRQK